VLSAPVNSIPEPETRAFTRPDEDLLGSGSSDACRKLASLCIPTMRVRRKATLVLADY
jgi:hypothetical protein